MDSKSSVFVKKLASNNRRTREAAIESLKQFLSKSKTLPELEYQKLWKGLFYAMWFSDGPRPQQRLANNLGLLFLETIPIKNFIPFTELFWQVISKEWSGIDQWRVDKFYMLIRRVVYYCFERLQMEKYDDLLLTNYLQMLSKVPLSGDKRVPNAIPYHIIDIYIDELEKSMFKDLNDEEAKEEEKDTIIEDTPVLKLLEPFTKLGKELLLKTLRQKILSDIFEDERLIAWGVVESKKVALTEEDKAVESDEEEEWTGF